MFTNHWHVVIFCHYRRDTKILHMKWIMTNFYFLVLWYFLYTKPFLLIQFYILLDSLHLVINTYLSNSVRKMSQNDHFSCIIDRNLQEYLRSLYFSPSPPSASLYLSTLALAVSVFTSLSLSRWRMEEFCVDRVLERSGIRLLKPSLSSSTCFSSMWMCVSSSPLQPCTSDSTSYIMFCICVGGQCQQWCVKVHAEKERASGKIRWNFLRLWQDAIWNDAFTCLSHLAEVHKCVALVCKYPLLYLHSPQPGNNII